MLDLDRLATKLASTLKESEDSWRLVFWSSDFQNLSRNMSDGEVETVVQSCPSPGHLRALVQFLQGSPGHSEPFATLMAMANSANLSLSDWIKTFVVEQ